VSSPERTPLPRRFVGLSASLLVTLALVGVVLARAIGHTGALVFSICALFGGELVLGLALLREPLGFWPIVKVGVFVAIAVGMLSGIAFFLSAAYHW
jgi:hypothetical protein